MDIFLIPISIFRWFFHENLEIRTFLMTLFMRNISACRILFNAFLTLRHLNNSQKTADRQFLPSFLSTLLLLPLLCSLCSFFSRIYRCERRRTQRAKANKKKNRHQGRERKKETADQQSSGLSAETPRERHFTNKKYCA